jgi:hypothetical protein
MLAAPESARPGDAIRSVWVDTYLVLWAYDADEAAAAPLVGNACRLYSSWHAYECQRCKGA